MLHTHKRSFFAILVGATFTMSAQVAIADADDDVLTLRFQHSYPPGTAFYEHTGQEFVERVEELSDGRIEFQVYEAGALASVGDMVSATDDGRIHVSISYGGFYVGDVPEADVETGLPLAWAEPWEVYDAYYNRGLKEVVAEAYESRFDVKYFPAPIGMQYAISTRDPVSSLDDLRGMNLRAPGIYGEFLEELGAASVTIPADEMYSALQQGTVDGAIYDVASIIPTGAHEFLSSAILDPHVNAGAGHFLINGDIWESLPEDLQEVFREAAQYGGAASANSYRASAEISVGELRAAGVDTVSLSDEEREQALSLAMNLWEEVAERGDLNAKGVEIVKQQMRDFGRIE